MSYFTYVNLVFISKANYHIIAKNAIFKGKSDEGTTKCDIKYRMCIYVNWWSLGNIFGIADREVL